MQIKRIGIKYCGGCNPKINRGQVAEEVTKILVSDGYLIVYNKFDVDFIIYLSGCLSNCAQKYNPCVLPNIVVADETVNFNTVNETRLSQEIAQSVRNYILTL